MGGSTVLQTELTVCHTATDQANGQVLHQRIGISNRWPTIVPSQLSLRILALAILTSFPVIEHQFLTASGGLSLQGGADVFGAFADDLGGLVGNLPMIRVLLHPRVRSTTASLRPTFKRRPRGSTRKGSDLETDTCVSRGTLLSWIKPSVKSVRASKQVAGSNPVAPTFYKPSRIMS